MVVSELYASDVSISIKNKKSETPKPKGTHDFS
jgi:hypothetical protein